MKTILLQIMLATMVGFVVGVVQTNVTNKLDEESAKEQMASDLETAVHQAYEDGKAAGLEKAESEAYLFLKSTCNSDGKIQTINIDGVDYVCIPYEWMSMYGNAGAIIRKQDYSS